MLSFQGGIRVASYTASKHGVLGMTRLLGQRMGGQGHQRQCDRAGLYRDQQHRGVARRSRPQRRDPRPHSRRPLGRAVRHRRRGGVPARAGPPTTCMAPSSRSMAAGWHDRMLTMTETKLFAQPDEGEWIDDCRRQPPPRGAPYGRVDAGASSPSRRAASAPCIPIRMCRSSYVAEGRFEVTIDGVTETVRRRRELHRAVQSRAWRDGAGRRAARRYALRRTAPTSFSRNVCSGIRSR